MFNQIGVKSITGIIGGPPCQAYSTIGRAANRSKKDTDNRIYLYRYYIEFLRNIDQDFLFLKTLRGS
nr:DNA cytosine methyltransferase [Streptococcus agalactiae]